MQISCGKGGQDRVPKSPDGRELLFQGTPPAEKALGQKRWEGSSGEDTMQKVTEGFPAEAKIPKSLNTKQVDSFLFNS